MQLETGALARWGTPSNAAEHCKIGAIEAIDETEKALLAKCKKDGKYEADQSTWVRTKAEVVNGSDTSECVSLGKKTAAYGPTKGCFAVKLTYKFPLSLEVEIYQEDETKNGDAANEGAYRDLLPAPYVCMGYVWVGYNGLSIPDLIPAPYDVYGYNISTRYSIPLLILFFMMTRFRREP